MAYIIDYNDYALGKKIANSQPTAPNPTSSIRLWHSFTSASAFRFSSGPNRWKTMPPK